MLPCLTLSSIMLPLFIRLVRGAMLVSGDDYVRTARAKSASPPRVWLNHALRNALLPLAAVGFQMAARCLHAVDRDGVPMARHGLSVSRGGTRDYLVFVGLLFVVTNTLVDIVSLTPDPRISLEGTR